MMRVGQPGRFITLEGGEGVGKSTLAVALKAKLESFGQEVCLTREPGGSTGAEALRTLLLSPPEGVNWSPQTQTLLVCAARRDHVENTILPMLQSGVWVICDRYSDSTRVYQGAAQGLNETDVETLLAFATETAIPDMTLLLDGDPVKMLQRRHDRGITDAFERRDLAFHETIRTGFLELAKRHGDRIAVLNADSSPEELVRASFEIIVKRGWT